MLNVVRLAIVIGAVALVPIGTVPGRDRPLEAREARGRLEGTWEHTFANAPEHRQVKIINPTHFVWVTYEREGGRPLVLGGGTYTLDGRTYKEAYEFGGGSLPAQLVGKEQVFTADLDGDTWTHEGTLSNGFHVKETWRKVKK
jgi:hypothetical protein